MKVKEAMTPEVKVADPNQSIREAAVLMGELDVGALPVGENDQLVGMITDRDIAIRAVAKGLKPDTKVRDVMSKDVKYCYEDEEVGEVAENMAEIKVRRLPVLNRQKRLVGIVAIADIAVDHGADSAGVAICGISQPGGEHSQTADGKGH